MKFLAATLALVAVVLAASVIVGESLWVGFLASQEQVADYRFGSESMVGHGGWAYERKANYVASGLLMGGGFLGVALICAVVALRSWRGRSLRSLGDLLHFLTCGCAVTASRATSTLTNLR